MTPDLERLAWQRKLDVRCRACGEGSALTARCYACGSPDLDIIPHGSDGWTHCLGGSGAPAERVQRDTSAATTARRDPGKAGVEATTPYTATFGL